MTDEPDDTRAAASGPRGAAGDPPVDLARFRARRLRERLLAMLDSLAAAAERRDVPALFRVLGDDAVRRHLPADVREELLQVVRRPDGQYRTPVRLFHHRYVLEQLGDEPLARTELADVDSPLAPVTPLPLRRSPFDGPRPGGAPRRRTDQR